MGRNKKTPQPQKQVGGKSSDKQFLLCVLGTFLNNDDISAISFENSYGAITIQRSQKNEHSEVNAIGFDIGSSQEDEEEDEDNNNDFDDIEDYKKAVGDYAKFFE